MKQPKGSGGEGGIRTLETLARLAVFKTAALVHYATSPKTFTLLSACGGSPPPPSGVSASLRYTSSPIFSLDEVYQKIDLMSFNQRAARMAFKITATSINSCRIAP